MSRKTLYTIIIALFILIFAGLIIGYFYINQKPASGPQSEQSGGGFLGNLFSLFNGNKAPESGNNEAASSSLSATTTVISDDGTLATIPRLRQISDKPTAGMTFMVRNVATTTIRNNKLATTTIPETFIRYLDRATGHIFETKPDSLDTALISNTTMPKIYQALFTNGGTAVILRYLNNDNNSIETYFSNLIAQKIATGTLAVSSTTPYQLSGSFLPENITELSLSPAKDQIFYLQDNDSGSVGVVSATNNTKQHQIFNYPLKEWLADWTSANNINLTTKPSGGTAGYLFLLNPSNGSLRRSIISNVGGLTVLTSPDSNYILYSASNETNFGLYVYNVKADTSVGLSLKTLPEKCVWSKKTIGVIYCAVPLSVPSGSFPDIWYQGAVSFADNFWMIDTKTGIRNLIGRPYELARANMDAVDLTLDSNENYLMFINKKDLTLWNLLIHPPAPAISSSTPANSLLNSSSSISSTTTKK